MGPLRVGVIRWLQQRRPPRVYHRISCRIAKNWSQRVRIGGRETNLGLGEGIDPRADHLPTFREATEKVIKLHSGKWKAGSRTADQWRSSLVDYAGSLGDLSIGVITSADILRCLSPIWYTKPATAQQVRRRIGAIMRWAIAAGYRADDPADQRVVAALGRNGNRATHQKALHHSAVGAAIANLEGSLRAHWATVAAMKFLVLTATRSGETRNATWNEIDLDGRVWTIPADRTKTARELRVPLSRAAVTVLEEAHQRTGGEGLVFPSLRGKAMTSAALSDLCKERNIGGVPHGFRSSFRDWCGESGVSREVAERALGHVVRNKAEAAYSRSDLLDLRRPVMSDWADYLMPGGVTDTR